MSCALNTTLRIQPSTHSIWSRIMATNISGWLAGTVISEEDTAAYVQKNNSQCRRRIIQLGDGIFKTLEEKTNGLIKLWSDQGRYRRNIATATQGLRTSQETKELLKSFANLDNRVIGHVLFSPQRSLHPKGWLRDWALIELDVKKFGDKPLTNMLYIGDISLES